MSMKTGPAIGVPDLVGAPENSALCPPTNVLLSSLTWNLRPHSGQCRKKSICDQPSRRESKCFSDHSCPQCLHLYEYWNSSMSTIIGFPSSTAMGVKEDVREPREPMLPLRTTPALAALLLGIDSRCSVTSLLLSSLMWNLRPHPGQCLKNSVLKLLFRLS